MPRKKNDFPEIIIPEINLSELIDTGAISSMMESFYRLTGIPMTITDIKGNILARSGWQDICAKFHRKHPVTSKKCLDSDLSVASDIPEGEFRLYKCKNGMRDMVTPLYFGKHRIGYLLSGQFFFEDEEPDTEFFVTQALKYNFNKDEYLETLRNVPRLKRSDVENAKSFIIKLANTLIQMGYNKMKLEKALADTHVLMKSLAENKFLLEQAQSIAHLGSWELDIIRNKLKWSDEVYRIFGITPHEFETTYESFLDAVHPDDREAVSKAYSDSLDSERDTYEIEHRIIRRNTGEIRYVHEKCEHFRNKAGDVVRSVGMVHDITERIKAEHEIRESRERLNKALDSLTPETSIG